MKIRISYVCVVFALVFSIRFWLLAQESNQKLQTIFEQSSQFDISKAQTPELIQKIEDLEKNQSDLIDFSDEMAKLNSKITRVPSSFLLLGIICYVIEERKRRKTGA